MFAFTIKGAISVQVCFSGEANLQKVEAQLKQIHEENPNYVFHCAFLPRHMMEEKGKEPLIDDLFNRVLGQGNMHYVTQDLSTFEEHCEHLLAGRQQLADHVNRMYVLDSGTAEGVREEVELFTAKKVILVK